MSAVDFQCYSLHSGRSLSQYLCLVIPAKGGFGPKLQTRHPKEQDRL